MRRWIVTALGLLMMAASVYGFVRFAERTEAEEAKVTAIMPARLIASGERIDASMLRTADIAEKALPSDALTRMEEIVGRTVVVPLGPNETIAAWKLADRQLTPREGERYVSFPTDDITNVGNMLRRGDRVDVWVEFEQPVELGGTLRGALKVVEGLTVASVRTPEGNEVADEAFYDTPFQSAGRQLERVRANANGRPSMNTFIMDEAVYEAYALASLVGTIKLALPEPSAEAGGDARVAAEFRQYRVQFINERGGGIE